MNKKQPAVYHHKFKEKPGFQRQSGEAVRIRSKAKYRANPEKAKAINAKWQREHPELHREAVSLWWQRNKHRPEVQERNRLKCKLQRMRKRIKRAWESLRIV